MGKPDKQKDDLFQKRLSYEKLGFYYLSLPILLFANLMGAFLLSAIQLNVVDLYSIVVWLSLSIVMFLYGLYQYKRFRKKTEESKLAQADIWLDKYYTDTLINGIIWGSSAFLMFPESNLLNQMMLVFFLFAVGFTAMGILASKRDLLITYISVMYLPLILRMIFMEDAVHSSTGYILLALVLLMAIIANYYGGVINNALRNKQDFIAIKQTHEKLKERFFSLFERAPVGIYYYNQNLEPEDANEHFVEMSQQKSKEKLLEMPLLALENRKIREIHESVFLGTAGEYRGPFSIADKKDLYVKLSTVPMINAAGVVAGGIAIINDITNEVTAKEKMVRNAYYDLLTDIPNRTLLMDKLKFHIAGKEKDPRYGALLFMDFDNFKKVNETFGHKAGDKLLQQASERMKTIISQEEIFARISGDKFVFLLPLLAEERKASEVLVKQYIRFIRDAFSEPLLVVGEEYHLSFSIGAVLFHENIVSAFDLLKKAETAMYEAKNSARGTSRFYQKEMGAYAKEALVLENDMHKAIARNEFSIVYQPQVDLSSDAIVSVEALVRWMHPTKGMVSPAVFIPIAEESGTIIKLEEWIHATIFEEIAALKKEDDTLMLQRIAVNLSAVHFMQPNFVEKFMLSIAKYKVDPHWIEIEITESGIMRNLDDAIEKMHTLKAFGFVFAIDDFGTGHSSLSYLKRLPADTIKIDQAFIKNMHQDKGDAMIVESVVSIGKKFGLKVLAEGVEESAALMHLRIIQCDLYQGNFGYKPMPMEALVSLLKQPKSLFPTA